MISYFNSDAMLQDQQEACDELFSHPGLFACWNEVPKELHQYYLDKRFFFLSFLYLRYPRGEITALPNLLKSR